MIAGVAAAVLLAACGSNAASDSESPADLTSIGKVGFSTLDSSYSAGALVVNNSDEDLFFTEVTFNFIGADGSPVETQTDYIEVIPAGSSVPSVVEVYREQSVATALEVTAFAEKHSIFETDWIEMELGPTTIGPGGLEQQLTGTVTNPADVRIDSFSYSVRCLVVEADGSVVGGTSTLPDGIAPGQTIAWKGFFDGPGGVSVECRSIGTITE